ncbi:hypothetical protein [Hoeflea sp.]|uniref:hypothetical protein n=1 Tax=Hoeflea sp. TaxID=1940281 RepID=UPI003A95A051
MTSFASSAAAAQQQALVLASIGFLLSGLGGYSIGSIPVQWFAAILPTLSLLPFIVARRLTVPIEIWPFILLFVWSVSVTLYHLHSFESVSLDIYKFVALRILKIVFFIGIVISLINLDAEHRERFLNVVILTGVIFSLYGFYCYFAHLNGWPEIPRTRAGTYEGPQSVLFTYPFHRLMGPFQEPSMFADWMLVPLMLAFRQLKTQPKRPWAGIILGAVMLTGSFAAALALSIGVLLVIAIWLIKREKAGWQPVMANVLIGIGVFYILVRGYEHSNGYRIVDTSEYSPFGLVWLFISDRLGGVIAAGEAGTNRAGSIGLSQLLGISWIGHGLGLGHIKIQFLVEGRSPRSFLSLYRFFLVSSGVIGLFILSISLVFPLLRMIRSWNLLRNESFLFALYVSCCIMFYGVMEELTYTFAVVLGLVCAQNQRKRPETTLNGQRR